jgi:hypothetical protein
MASSAFEACLALASSLIRSLPAVLQALSVLANFCCVRRVDSISSSSSSQIELNDCSNWNELPDESVELLCLFALFVMRSQIKAPARGKAKGNTIFRRRFLMLSAFLLSIEKISSFLHSQWNKLLTTICMLTQSCSYIALPSGLNYAKFVQVFNHPYRCCDNIDPWSRTKKNKGFPEQAKCIG